MKNKFTKLVFVILLAVNHVLYANPTQDSNLIVISTSRGWGYQTAELVVFDKIEDQWIELLRFPAVLGSKGMGWGRGLHDSFVSPEPNDPIKKEGDKKAPAGVFSLIETFGYQETIPEAHLNLPIYTQVSSYSRCVDDPYSVFYNNQVYDERGVHKDWNYAEKLKRDDHLYKYAIVVDHNQMNQKEVVRPPKSGSCIFMHLWRNSSTGTLGCTAMAESNMLKLLKVLDSEKNPLLIQMPKAIYEKYAVFWNLPLL